MPSVEETKRADDGTGRDTLGKSRFVLWRSDAGGAVHPKQQGWSTAQILKHVEIATANAIDLLCYIERQEVIHKGSDDYLLPTIDSADSDID